MSTPAPQGADSARRPLIRATPLNSDDDGIDLRRLVPAWIISGVIHVTILSLALLVTMSSSAYSTGLEQSIVDPGASEEVAKDDQDFIVEDIGDPTQPVGGNSPRIEEVNMPGPANINDLVGVLNGRDDVPLVNVPPPLGFGTDGDGAGIKSSDKNGTAPMTGENPGGTLRGKFAPWAMNGRSGASKVEALIGGGGNTESEAAVARGLNWLLRHQALDGHWGLNDFHVHGKCTCTGAGGQHDVAGTAMGLLPFLGAGDTHKGSSTNRQRVKAVELALKWLITRQGADGSFSGNGYEHALATIAICEAYGMTADPNLRGPSQRAINACVAWQNNAGGFRYSPRIPGDLSVTGWFVQALKSGYIAGLNVPNATWAGINTYLDTVSTPDGAGYGYQQPQPAPTVTAVGLLSRQYMGWGPRNPGMVKGSDYLLKLPPSPNFRNIYYYYYATQVMYNQSAINPEGWKQWNEKMRDLLIKTQDMGLNADHKDQKGSWSAEGDAWGPQMGRLGETSLALLTLEVYYRHLPLYKKIGALKNPNPNLD
jgi:hypothetical protein